MSTSLRGQLRIVAQLVKADPLGPGASTCQRPSYARLRSRVAARFIAARVVARRSRSWCVFLRSRELRSQAIDQRLTAGRFPALDDRSGKAARPPQARRASNHLRSVLRDTRLLLEVFLDQVDELAVSRG